MLQILELSPTNLDLSGLLSQFQEMTSLSFPALDGFPTPDSLPIPNLDGLLAAVKQFEEMAQKLGEGPEAFSAVLLQPLQQMTGGTLDMSNLLGSLTETAGPLGGLPAQLQTFFQQFSSDILPVFQLLQGQTVDTSFLGQLFQLDALATQLPQEIEGLLQGASQDVTAIEPLIAPLVQAAWLSAYQSALQAVLALEAGATITADSLNTLSDATLQQIETGIQTLESGVETAVSQLTTFNQNLASLTDNLSTAVTTVFHSLDPQTIAGQITFFDDAIQSLDSLKLDEVAATIETAVQSVDSFIGKGVDQVIAAVDTAVSAILQVMETAKQALVKISALLSDLLTQIKGFIEQANLTGLIEDVKAAFNTFALKANQLLDQVSQMMNQVYGFVRGLIDKIAQFDFRPIIDGLYNMLHQITAILDHPEVRRVLEQAKEAIAQLADGLDSVSVKPVFDQVVLASDDVKAKLQAINTAQLNAILRQALKAALNVVTTAIDPPTKVTDVVKEQYNTTVKPITTGLIDPIEEQFKQILAIIDQFEPGTLVANLLTPPFEALVNAIKGLIEPEQILTYLKPLNDFYTSILAELDKNVNPANLLAPLLAYYDQLLNFVKALTPEVFLTPINDLIGQATGLLNQLDLEGIINQVKSPVAEVVGFVTDFRLEEQPFWASVEPLLAIELQTLVDGFVQPIQAFIAGLDLSLLQPILGALQTAVSAIQSLIQKPPLLDQLKSLSDQVVAAARDFTAKMTTVADQWQAANGRIAQLTIPDELTADFAAFQARLERLNPVKLLATATSLVDQLDKLSQSLYNTLSQSWQTLIDLFNQGAAQLENLLAGTLEGGKTFLSQLVDLFIAGPLQKVAEKLNPPLVSIKQAVNAVLSLQNYLDVLKVIPESMDRLGTGVLSVKDTIVGFNLNFLSDELQGIMDSIIAPLEALQPRAFVDELVAIYQRVLDAIGDLNPVTLIGAARGTVLMNRQETAVLFIPIGTRLLAQTPVGEMHYKIIQALQLAAGQTDGETLIQSLVTGRGGDIVAVEGVSWRVNMPEGSPLLALTPSHTAPILSLTTLVYDVVVAKLEVLHPAKLIAEPLNEPYQKILAIKEELGLERIFEILFAKFDRIEQDVFNGLDRSAVAFGGVLTAIPV